MNQLDPKGRHAVVTGGAAGLGFAISQRLLRRSNWARTSRWLRWTHGDHASVASAVRQTLKGHASIDVLVNCAGVTGPNAKVRDYPVDAWSQMMRVNLIWK